MGSKGGTWFVPEGGPLPDPLWCVNCTLGCARDSPHDERVTALNLNAGQDGARGPTPVSRPHVGFGQWCQPPKGRPHGSVANGRSTLYSHRLRAHPTEMASGRPGMMVAHQSGRGSSLRATEGHRLPY